MFRVTSDLMEEIVRRIVEVVQPRRIILFGSRARGDAQSESDIDLLVIADSKEPRHRRSAPIYGALSKVLIPMDIVVFTPEEVAEWREVRQAFVTTAVREGKVLYEKQG
ncbi:MAG: nucleotidyltransferase domain-containing protein [Planctomycetes bacterium]|nr:nucleotidyltransferase domain-containing protein [Planctomycetota bacterium]MBM4078468.1 nucleotidyltransferase domain-containing protein [Planctomycetota bacterium]MBM4084837.1 nucleotidyltransferase domain-containing protein [Planctomycetota bacterium]